MLGRTLALALALWLCSPPAQAQYKRKLGVPRKPSAMIVPAEGVATPPPGYRREERLRTGLVIAGAITSVAGVGLTLSAHQIKQASRNPGTPSYYEFFYVYGAIHLAVGLPMLLYGLLDRKTVFVSEQSAWQLVPEVGPGHAAGRLRLTF